VISPNGKVLLEPQVGVEKMIFYTIENMDQIYEERMSLDTSGHYNRRDVFEFRVNKGRG
jgi:hypothetical protein